MAARFAFQTVPERIFRQLVRRSTSGLEVLGRSQYVNSVSTEHSRKYRAVVCTELKKPLEVQTLSRPELKPEEGDRVIAVTEGKGMAEECIINQKLLWKVPKEVSYEEAAALPVSYGTGLLALQHRAATQPGEVVLVTAAAGGAGLAAVDIAANVLQAKVIAAAGSDEKCKIAVQKGASSSINYSSSNLKEELKKLTNSQGVDVVFDAVGGEIFKDSLSSLSWEGRIVVVGFAGGAIPSIPANLLLLKNISAMGVYWGRYRNEDFGLFSKSIFTAIQLCKEGKIRPHIGAVYKLHQVNEAFLHVAQRKSIGKVIVSMR
ncbi:quinone oxidoreductase-like protein 2 isoform X2 [Polypterus senegalus]|uniref:quinone oxidoreductase-like protein 2 isoform X2 n=1 Tax=Polypterus senegalus TaxID=55291 RepID=UPI001965CD05|nr:quinone oxidoreductase-like protein 2 isoform X2 [Polypterus senegalus]